MSGVTGFGVTGTSGRSSSGVGTGSGRLSGSGVGVGVGVGAGVGVGPGAGVGAGGLVGSKMATPSIAFKFTPNFTYPLA